MDRIFSRVAIDMSCLIGETQVEVLDRPTNMGLPDQEEKKEWLEG